MLVLSSVFDVVRTGFTPVSTHFFNMVGLAANLGRHLAGEIIISFVCGFRCFFSLLSFAENTPKRVMETFLRWAMAFIFNRYN